MEGYLNLSVSGTHVQIKISLLFYRHIRTAKMFPEQSKMLVLDLKW
jgi:hypothetical protein